MALILRLWTGEPEAGLWCPKCLKPSGIRVPLYSVSEQGVSTLGTLSTCHDHQGPL